MKLHTLSWKPKKHRKRVFLLLAPLAITLFLSVGYSTLSAQVETSILTMQGKDWNVRVDQNMQTETVLSQPYAVVTKQGQEKELFLPINDIKECASGVIEFKVAVSGLIFYKQLPLDQELKLDERIAFVNATHALDKEGNILTYRPLNVVNSFAGFDSLGRKQLHVYASKIIDAKGQEIWLDQDLGNGLLSVYLPDQKTLEGLTYPLMLDPTFGYTSIGGSQYNSWAGGVYYACKFTSPEAGDITSISAYVGYTTSVNWTALIKADNSGVIGSTLATGTKTTSGDLSGGYEWVESSIDYTMTGSTDYWLVFDPEENNNWNMKYDSGDTSQGYANTVGYLDYEFSIYATYTAGEPTPTPTPTATPTSTPTASPTPLPSGTYWYQSISNVAIFVAACIIVSLFTWFFYTKI